MIITLHRDTFTEKTTIGKLYVNGIEYCETLEDVDRKMEDFGAQAKVYGKTCIPRGTYKIRMELFVRHKKMMPMLEDVPGFTGIFIHSGNYAEDTEGCILVGRTRGVDFIGDSRQAYDMLFRDIDAAMLQGEDVTITVT